MIEYLRVNHDGGYVRDDSTLSSVIGIFDRVLGPCVVVMGLDIVGFTPCLDRGDGDYPYLFS